MPELSFTAKKTADIGGFTRSVGAHYSHIKTLIEDTKRSG